MKRSTLKVFAWIQLGALAVVANQCLPRLRGQTPPPANPQAASVAPLTLGDLEEMALARNPTLAEAANAVRAAQGRKLQAGLFPNPTVSYHGDEIAGGPILRGGEHGMIVSQTLVTAHKLGVSRGAAAAQVSRTQDMASAQRERVLTGVRLLYYQALGAERLVHVRSSLLAIAQDAVQTSEGLYNVGQADRPDLLEAQIEEQQAELALAAARQARVRAWRQLAAVVGDPSLEQRPLAGKLDTPWPQLDPKSSLQSILDSSPAVKAAEARVEQARLTLKRARVQEKPDVRIEAGVLDNRERLETIASRPVGLVGYADVNVELPIFNRNQGNVKAAAAELAAAREEVERVRLTLRSRYAAVFTEYADSSLAAERYKAEMLPRAREAYQMYLTRYRQMAASYPQVLIAQRTMFQLEEQYVQTLVQLRLSVAKIQGLLLTGGLERPAGISRADSADF
ncbi:MAG: TolC family protein [Terriglobia bacterium]